MCCESVPQGQEHSSPDHRRYSMMEPSAQESEVSRLRQRLHSTEDALRNALEHNQQVDQLVQAMRKRPDKSPVSSEKSVGNKKTKTKTIESVLTFLNFYSLCYNNLECVTFSSHKTNRIKFIKFLSHIYYSYLHISQELVLTTPV